MLFPVTTHTRSYDKLSYRCKRFKLLYTVLHGQILGNPGMMNAVGTEWVTPGLPSSGYGIGHAWVTEDDKGQVSRKHDFVEC